VEADRYSGVPALGCKSGRQSTREEVGRNPDQGFCPKTLEGANPGEHPAVGVLITRLIARDSPVGSNPRNRGSSSRPSHFGAEVYRRAKRYVGSFGRKRPEYQPRGESSEG
jgi:hypothetical protein